MYVVDASVWVSRFVPADVHHKASYHWLESVVARGHLVASPALLLVEVAGAISRRTGRAELAAQAVTQLEQLPRGRLVPVGSQLAVLAAGLAGQLHLRGGDAIYLALAQRLAFSLVTWDREQLERGSPVATVTTPEGPPVW